MIIKKQTALLAKEKGFNLPVLGYYLFIHKDEDDEESIDEITDYEEYSNYGFPKRFLNDLRNNFNHIPIEYDIEYLSAPYQFELQAWLRDNYKIDVLLILRSSGKYSFDIYHYDNPNSNGERTRYGCLNSHANFYEAFEEGLNMGLNLIK